MKNISQPSLPLIKALAQAGIGSRRSLADAIKQLRVKVNGAVVEDFRYPVNIATDHISLDNTAIQLKRERLVYLVLNKPRGVVSTTNDELGRGSVTDLLPPKYHRLRLYPVGRLDKNSSGLLLLTNDGELTYLLTHPRFEHEKEYLIAIRGRLQYPDKRRLEQGIVLEDGTTFPAIIKKVKNPPYNYSITIHEGKNRQVRRMFDALGYRVLALQRIRTGNITLGDLAEGATRLLSAQEVRGLLTDNPP